MTCFRTGFITIIGPPNAGKSTFLNQVLGTKVAIVSPKPQTTRTNVTGIYTSDQGQIIFLDTPGVHIARSKLNRSLVDAAWRSLAEAHGVLLFLDGAKYAQNLRALEQDLRPLTKRLGQCALPMVVALNKIDMLKTKAHLLEVLSLCAQYWPEVELIPISARTGEGISELLTIVHGFLPRAEALFPQDQLSTMSLRFMASEIIREKLFLVLQQELPYHVAVEIEEWTENPLDNQTTISALIYTSKNSHKGIIVGRQGKNLKLVGQQARQDLRSLLETKVHLNLWVKVRERWTEDTDFLTTLGL